MAQERIPGQTFFEATVVFSDVVGWNMDEQQLSELFAELLSERADIGVRDVKARVVSKEEWEGFPENN